MFRLKRQDAPGGPMVVDAEGSQSEIEGRMLDISDPLGPAYVIENEAGERVDPDTFKPMHTDLVKVIAFDCFGTVFDASDVPEEDVRAYVAQTRRNEWGPLFTPPSFMTMPAHSDAAEGIRRLREKYRVVTCSNLPLRLLAHLSSRAGIEWDAIVPVEVNRVYKPHPLAYWAVCQVMQVEKRNVLVVSAHADGPDVRGAPAAQMQFQLIRNPGHPQTIIELAESLK